MRLVVGMVGLMGWVLMLGKVLGYGWWGMRVGLGLGRVIMLWMGVEVLEGIEVVKGVWGNGEGDVEEMGLIVVWFGVRGVYVGCERGKKSGDVKGE